MMNDLDWLSNKELNELKERGFESSPAFETDAEAYTFASSLYQIKNDPSFIVSIAGLYFLNETHVQVIHKIRFTN